MRIGSIHRFIREKGKKMSRGITHIPSLEEYARIRKFNSLYNQLETLCCEECKYCRSGVNACIFGNQIRNLETITSCPKISKFL